MKRDCPICIHIADPKKPRIYEDETVAVLLEEQPGVLGQSIVVPKEHYPIIELVPDEVLAQCALIANKASVAVFDALGATGSNLLISNGVPAGQKLAHFGITIIPRRVNDRLDFAWKTRQLTEEEMSTVELKLKAETDHIGGIPHDEKKPIHIDVVERSDDFSSDEGEDDYSMKQLERVP